VFIGIGLLLSMVLAGGVSYYASSSPDGLEKVAGDVGFLDSAEDSAAAGSPLSDYGVEGIADERLSVGLSGIIGVVLVGIVAFGLFLWLGRRSSSTAPDSADVGT
jgi:hypothetical protein